jgi:hypothetical protein
MSFSHGIKKEEDGYKIALYKIDYFIKKELGVICEGVPDEKTAKGLTTLLDKSFNAGLEIGKQTRSR